MRDQVSVRLAVVGGNEFRSDLRQAGAEGARAMQPLQAAARTMSPALREVTAQASTMFASMAGGSPAIGGLASALGRATLAATPLGIAMGVAFTVLTSFVPKLFEGGKAASDLAEGMDRIAGSTGAVQGAVSGLEGVQQAYNAAIREQGPASSAAAAAVVANSRAEFAARKQVLASEIELLRVRQSKIGLELTEKEDKIRSEGQAAMDSDKSIYGYANREGMGEKTGFANRRQMGRPMPTPAFDEFAKGSELARLELRKLRAEGAITAIVLKQSEDALATAFDALGTDDGKGGKAAKAVGGAKAVNKAVAEGQKIFDQTRTAAERYAAEVAKLNELLAQGAIDQDTYNRRLKQLDSEFKSAGAFAVNAAQTVKGAMTSLFDGIFEGGQKAGDVIENLGKKLASMALQESAFRLLSRLMPNTFGANGFIPLLANADGNAFSNGRVTPFASGGVVSGPTMFPMRGGTGLMGEAGPEAIMPLTRVGGKLGVRSAGGAGMTVQIIDQRSGGAEIRQERQTGPDGRETLRVVVSDEIGKGAFDRANRGRYGMAPQKVRR